MGSDEPKALRQGKRFHKMIQEEWLATAEGGRPRAERSIKRLDSSNGRIDILVEEIGDFVSVVKIKGTDWDKMTHHNVIRNAKRQIRQIWSYVRAELDVYGQQVCPGVIFPRLPQDRERIALIESLFNDEGIQVVWHEETGDHLRERLAKMAQPEAAASALKARG